MCVHVYVCMCGEQKKNAQKAMKGRTLVQTKDGQRENGKSFTDFLRFESIQKQCFLIKMNLNQKSKNVRGNIRCQPVIGNKDMILTNLLIKEKITKLGNSMS